MDQHWGCFGAICGGILRREVTGVGLVVYRQLEIPGMCVALVLTLHIRRSESMVWSGAVV